MDTPVLRLIHSPGKVEKLYQQFQKLLLDGQLFPALLNEFPLRSRSGEAADHAVYSPFLNMWASSGGLGWNAFGVGKVPVMVVQVNFQDYHTAARKVGAAFARDAAGQPIVVHRGHIGGGREGIGRQLMLEAYAGERAILSEEDGTQTPCFIVGQLDSPLFGKQLAAFVANVQRLKQAGTRPGLSGIAQSLLQFDNQLFQPERPGKNTRAGASKIEFTHAVVVNELEKQLKKLVAARGWLTSSDVHRDLLLLDERGARALFEVKSNLTTQTLCTGLGQLLLYSVPLPAAKRILVLPEKLPTAVMQQLAKWGILALYYRWHGTALRFQHLEELVAGL